MTRWTPEEDGAYWVIGGEYTCTRFRQLRRPAAALGPFRRRADAEAVWRQLSYGSTALATTRYVVVEEQGAQLAA